ncbi:MAG: SRPBCC family protein [Bacteroidales bacterium]|nr:MAG: SRPBCC family protein [Bacteroidales bacterium]
MKLFEPLVLRDSVEIDTTPENIWKFFKDLEINYKIWHPEDHILFRCTKGQVLEKGSTFYAEQYVMGKVQKYKGTFIEIVPNRKIVFKFSFPVSIITPRIEWLIEPKGSVTVFTAITYMRLGKLYQKLFKKSMGTLVEAHDKHVGEEGENLKKIMES